MVLRWVATSSFSLNTFISLLTNYSECIKTQGSNFTKFASHILDTFNELIFDWLFSTTLKKFIKILNCSKLMKYEHIVFVEINKREKLGTVFNIKQFQRLEVGFSRIFHLFFLKCQKVVCFIVFCLFYCQQTLLLSSSCRLTAICRGVYANSSQYL